MRRLSSCTLLRPLVEISGKFTLVNAQKQKQTFRLLLFFFGVVVASIASVYCFVSVPTIP